MSDNLVPTAGMSGAAAMPLAAADHGSLWYAVQTRVGREHIALLHLGRQGFESFCPMQLRPRSGGARPNSGMSPFFPGYVFVRLDLDRQRWRSINGTIGVVRLVSFGSGNRPAPLPCGFVERLQQLSGGGALRFDDGLDVGDSVRIACGPFADLCGVLESASGGERVTVLLQLLAKDTRVQLRRDMLVAA